MSYYQTRYSLSFGGPLTTGVKYLLFITGGAFLLQMLDQVVEPPVFVTKFGLVPALVTGRFYLWQLITYLFLHGGLFHLLINMLVLWMFGGELERAWGTRRFLKYYFFTGVGAGVCIVALSWNFLVPTIGASGAIYGLLLAYGILFPDRIIYLYFLIPVRAKYFVAIIGFFAFLGSISGARTGVSHIGHLGGLVCGLIYLKGGRLVEEIRYWHVRRKREKLRQRWEYYGPRRSQDDSDDFPPTIH
ncbi:MAG: rhomboid family intramembrane serine protease [Acidobacteria bacterium]|nr:rhomboid family intramembrane serine protease [Acidobacteriota bacterium]